MRQTAPRVLPGCFSNNQEYLGDIYFEIKVPTKDIPIHIATVSRPSHFIQLIIWECHVANWNRDATLSNVTVSELVWPRYM